MSITLTTVPLQSTPQSFSISLAGTVYNLTIKWNWIMQSWVIDIADSQNNPMVGGIPLITGADLLEQYQYLGIDGVLIVGDGGTPDATPTFTNLGSTCFLYFATQALAA